MFNFKKISLIKSIPLIIIFIILSLSIGFSALQSDMIIGDIGANVRVQKDIRVTRVVATNPVSSASSYWEEYNVNNISSSINLPNSDSTMTYYVTITNYGNVEAGISSISGLPSNLKYTINNYSLNNTLCDDTDSSKCKLGSISTLEITISYKDGEYVSSNTNFVFEMDFTFYYLDAVARIGNSYYDTLQEAINDVDNDNVERTIFLLKNTSEVITINAGQNIVFDFQGSTLSNSGSNNVIKNYGTLKIISGTISTSADQGAINNYGDLFVSGGNIIVSGARQAIYNDGGNVTISGSSYLYNNTTQRAVVQNQANSSLTILGGKIVAARFAAVVNNGTLVVGKNDDVINRDSPILQGLTYGISSSTNYSLYDGIIKGKTSSFNNDTIITKASGYDFLYSKELVDTVYYQTAILAHVALVTFDPTDGTVDETTRTVEIGTAIGSLPIPTLEDYVFDGWFTAASGGTKINNSTIINNNVNYYAHWTRSSEVYVAMINDTKYHTLAAAITAAPYNTLTTIKLIRDTMEKITIPNSKNIIFDFQTYTLSNIDKDPVVSNSGTLKIISGTISSTSANAAVVNNTGNLTVSGGNLTATGLRQAIYNDGGTTTIEGTAYLSATTSQRATVQNRASGTTNITGGTIISSGYAALYCENGTINLGVKDGNISSSTPVVRGATYGVVNDKTFNFYDGIIKGVTGIISGSLSDSEGTIVNSTEEIDGVTYFTEYLH